MDIEPKSYEMTLRNPDALMHWKIIECITQNEARYTRLMTVVPDAPNKAILALGNENDRWILSKFIMNDNCRKHATLDNAIRDTKDGEMIINITELQLYGVFTVEGYLQFLRNLHSGDELDNPIKYCPKQIVLTGWPQKIVFLCNSDEKMIEKVRCYVMKCFGSDIMVTRQGGETTVSVCKPQVNDNNAAVENFRKLVDMIDKNAGDDELTRLNLRMNHVRKISGETYQAHELSDGKNAVDVTTLLKELHSIRAVNFIVQINDNHGNIAVGGNVNINVNGGSNDEMNAIEWIKINPPGENELSSVYYNRFTKAMGPIISITIFGRFVKNSGYGKKKSGGYMKWYKKV